MSRTLFVMAMTAFMFTATASHAAVGPVPKCQSKKLNAWGKLRACQQKETGKATRGKPSDVAACKTKFDTALAKAGSDCRYLDNRDGTVTDLDTGLMWQKTDDGGGLADKDNTYIWSEPDGDDVDPDGSAFTVFLAGLNKRLSRDGVEVAGGYAGHCDWRLPAIDELKPILLQPSPCGSDPCIDQSAFGPTNAGSSYWSGTSLAGFSGADTAAWSVDFGGASAFSDGKWSDLHARAVRRAF